ncbi:hypothetical protein [Streptomyces sp. CB01881]|uniref:hypothetical protein n=1 Tax=Streptomyces sp. CB01881 TaxID=2078691 RepID=UPI000CDCD565|nr:hypothetical protein [Streptomyces sp. CB01881]AUY53497.1 hypothetical protein C2142_36650 [Streptomyces sp. CB01881]TYC69646.1 hypothetical protein EH183_36690 [Streptomyces sp. CB01881]
MNEHITRRLREAAEAHQPDRARILARVERGAAGPPVRHRTRSGLRSWPRAALTGLATAGILATGGLAVAGIARTPPSATVTTAPAAPSPIPTPTPTPTPSAPPTAAAPAPAPATTSPAGPRPTPSASSRAQNGPLWSEGSIDQHSNVYWGQNNLALRTAQPLTSLTVELRIAQTGNVKDTGNWRTLPADDFTVTVQESGGALVYRWVLKPGRTVPAGQHEFAGQYNHAPGARSATSDGYRVDAQSAGGSASVQGGFAPAR